MRLFDYLTFLVLVVLYVPRLALFYCYRLLIFISKQGSLYLLPALLGGLLYWQYDTIIQSGLYQWWLHDVVMHYFPHNQIELDYWYLGFFWGCFTFVLYLITGGKYQPLGTILSALPRISRPFPPNLRLRLVERKIRPATVKLAVLPLKRKRHVRAPDATEGLPEPLQTLLEPPQKLEEVQEAPKPHKEPTTAAAPSRSGGQAQEQSAAPATPPAKPSQNASAPHTRKRPAPPHLPPKVRS